MDFGVIHDDKEERNIFIFEIYGLFSKDGEKVGSVVSIAITNTREEALRKIKKPVQKEPRLIFQER